MSKKRFSVDYSSVLREELYSPSCHPATVADDMCNVTLLTFIIRH